MLSLTIRMKNCPKLLAVKGRVFDGQIVDMLRWYVDDHNMVRTFGYIVELFFLVNEFQSELLIY